MRILWGVLGFETVHGARVAFEERNSMSGFAAVGSNVQIDPGARFFGAESISLGSNVRIDTGAILSAQHPITIGDYVHIAAGAKVYANCAPCRIADFVSLSPDAKVFTGVDDFTDGHLTNPTVGADFRRLSVGAVMLEKHVLIGAGAIVFPGSHIGFGASVGALSFAKGQIEAGAIIVGPTMRRIGNRDLDELMAHEEAFIGAARPGPEDADDGRGDS